MLLVGSKDFQEGEWYGDSLDFQEGQCIGYYGDVTFSGYFLYRISWYKVQDELCKVEAVLGLRCILFFVRCVDALDFRGLRLVLDCCVRNCNNFRDI